MPTFLRHVGYIYFDSEFLQPRKAGSLRKDLVEHLPVYVQQFIFITVRFNQEQDGEGELVDTVTSKC